MGCDIHLYVEVKEKEKWVAYRGEMDNPDYDPDGYSWHRHETLTQLKPRWERDDDEDFILESVFYSGRNYDLFAILANVRNGYGFAGCDTGNGFNPILGRENPARGLPEDASPEVTRESVSWDGDGHSHNWLTVQELLDYDWDQTTKQRGVVPLSTYKDLRGKDQSPECYSGGISGLNIVTVTPRTADSILNGEVDPETDYRLKGKEIFTTLEWAESYREAAGDCFLGATLGLLQQIGDPQNVRIVFWFDN